MTLKYIASILCFAPWIVGSEESLPVCSETEVSFFGSKPVVAKKACKIEESSKSDIEIKAGYFFFASPRMRDVYNSGGADVQVSGAWGFWHWLRLYGSVEYLQRSGHAHTKEVPIFIEEDSSTIWEIPISLGLQARFTHALTHSSKKISGYFTIGPKYFFAHVHNRSHYVDRSMNQNGLGGFLNVGMAVALTSHWMVDCFGEGSYCKLHFKSSHEAAYGHNVQVGGITFGGGFGYIF